jgi:hypothetical protein
MFHVKHFFGLLGLLGACSSVCVDNDFGEWVFTHGQWVHCDSWVAACELSRERSACETDARNLGCKL